MSLPFPSPYVSPFVKPFAYAVGHSNQVNQHVKPPEADFDRCLNYYADYSGCGFWRMIWPEHVLNAHQKMIVHGTTMMSFDPNYFAHVKSVRIQRQATEYQAHFVRALRQLADTQGFRIIYEIDDIIFSEDIPDYNKYKPAFTDPKIRQTAQEIMAMCDEITVTCDFMKDYYMAKTGNKNITVIPNYPPEFWIGNYFNPRKVEDNFRKFCCGKNAKPRVLYPGSGAHFDVENRVNQDDDFAHVREMVAKTAHKFQWVFMGAFPLPLRDFVKQGLIEFHPWKRLYDYPKMIADLNVNAIVAPLRDNTFNRAKSDLKFIEAGCFGIPAVCQDLVTYSNSLIKFNTGDEMIDQLDKLFKNSNHYKAMCKAHRDVAETRFLELDNNIDKYKELYTLPYKDPKRVLLNAINK